VGVAFNNNRFGAGDGPIHLDDVSCGGDEVSLADCQHAGWGNNNCEHSEDVSIMCADNLDITGNILILYCFFTAQQQQEQD